MREVLFPVLYSTLLCKLFSHKRSPRKTTLAAVLLFGLLVASPASSEIVPWASQGALTNEITYTLSIDCAGGGIVCNALNAYSDVQVATATGAADLDLDLVAGTLQFQQDSTQDVGAGPQAAFATVDASDMTFASIPFVGAPMTEQGLVFALTNPVISAGGPLSVGSFPITAVVDYSAIADIVGPVDAHVPDIVVTPQAVTLTGTLDILAITSGGGIFYQITDLSGGLMVSNPTTLLGETVTVNVTADMILNLGGNTISGGGGSSTLPALGGWGVTLLVVGVGLAGARLSRRRLSQPRDGS